jgi:hypothetical protein
MISDGKCGMRTYAAGALTDATKARLNAFVLLNEAIYLISQPSEASVLLCSFMPDNAIVKRRVGVQGYE